MLAHRCDVTNEIEIELVKKRGVNGGCHVDREQRVAISGRTHDCFRADIGGTPRAILDTNCCPSRSDNHWPISRATMSVPPAGANRHDDAHRPRRISLRQAKRDTAAGVSRPLGQSLIRPAAGAHHHAVRVLRGSDIVARADGQWLSERTCAKHSVSRNRAGGASISARKQRACAADGYPLLHGRRDPAINATLFLTSSISISFVTSHRWQASSTWPPTSW